MLTLQHHFFAYQPKCAIVVMDGRGLLITCCNPECFVSTLESSIGLVHRRIVFALRTCHVYNMDFFYFFFHDNMVYWEFLVTGELEFTQFDPLVAEKHSGLQGLKWEGTR